MGYTTEFAGQVEIVPALNLEEFQFLKKFSETRRMDREKGPYFVGGSGEFGQGIDPDIQDYNSPPLGQPGLWCKWIPSVDGKFIEWDGGEKFYDAPEWMKYLIEHFLKPGCLARQNLPFLQGNHTLNGEIQAQGEEAGDSWVLIVKDNEVSVARHQKIAVLAEPVDWDVVSGKGGYQGIRTT